MKHGQKNIKLCTVFEEFEETSFLALYKRIIIIIILEQYESKLNSIYNL
jgi:hypothetical protein